MSKVIQRIGAIGMLMMAASCSDRSNVPQEPIEADSASEISSLSCPEKIRQLGFVPFTSVHHDMPVDILISQEGAISVDAKWGVGSDNSLKAIREAGELYPRPQLKIRPENGLDCVTALESLKKIDDAFQCEGGADCQFAGLQ